VVQPRSTAVIAGNAPPRDLSRLQSEHSVTNEELTALLAKKELWKKEKIKKNAAAAAQ